MQVENTLALATVGTTVTAATASRALALTRSSVPWLRRSGRPEARLAEVAGCWSGVAKRVMAVLPSGFGEALCPAVNKPVACGGGGHWGDPRLEPPGLARGLAL